MSLPTTTNTTLKLTYFEFTGSVELARLLFTFSGLAFIDNRLTRSEFSAIKATLPLGQLPTLEVDGVVYAQSMAIARYAAKIAGLYPIDAEQTLHVDMISETLIDLIDEMVGIKYRTSDEAMKLEKTTPFVTDGLPKTLAVLENMVRGAFFSGDSATLADLHFFDVVHNFVKTSFQDASLDAFPKLDAIVKAVETNANVAAYLAK